MQYVGGEEVKAGSVGKLQRKTPKRPRVKGRMVVGRRHGPMDDCFLDKI